MACANPFQIKTKGYLSPLRNWLFPAWYDVPCGYCLNCRKDKQNYYIDRANYEYCKRLVGAFVTFTYNDIWLLSQCACRDVDGSLIYDKDSHGNSELRCTLNYRDLTKFIDSIRHYIVSHPEIQGPLCQPDFSYLYCGEYGDEFGRPHFHVLFFGLDFAYCKKLIFNSWKYGFIDVLPILDGGIRYVCKYLDKQTFGYLAQMQYDFKGIARPKIRMSKGFGKGLLLDNQEDIVAHDYTYPIAHGNRRPISQYWRQLLHGNVLSRNVTKTHAYKVRMQAKTALEMRQYHLKDCHSDEAQKAFRLNQARIRERNLEIQIRNAGYPVECYKDVRFNKFGFSSYHRQKIHEIPIDIQVLLADDYRRSLPYGDEVPF